MGAADLFTFALQQGIDSSWNDPQRNQQAIRKMENLSHALHSRRPILETENQEDRVVREAYSIVKRQISESRALFLPPVFQELCSSCPVS